MVRATYTVYIIECVDKTLYTGIARDVEKRFAEHAAGKGARYTRSHPPRRIVYRESCKDRAAASRREYEIKRLSRAEKLTRIRAARRSGILAT
jgi:putative endonuclease